MIKPLSDYSFFERDDKKEEPIAEIPEHINCDCNGFLIIPQQVFDHIQEKNKQGRDYLNTYVCEKCGHHVLTLDLEAGVTPFMILCERCDGTMTSRCYHQHQPNFLWYRPKTYDELHAYTTEYIINKNKGKNIHTCKLRVMIAEAMAMNLDHWEKGGLFRIPNNKKKKKPL